jgi:2-methylisocitrate lyase-like PEP mutase family enzyme
MNKSETFRQLHHQNKPLLLGNVWNAHSARLFEKNGYKAIGTSSAAVANSLGYEDGEKISFDELLFVVKRIVAVVNIPVSADMEGGYSNSVTGVISNIEKLHDAGVAGINIEDSHQKEMTTKDVFSKKLGSIKNHLEKKNMKMFINARTDAFILKLPASLETTVERIKAYEQAGADGVFVPLISEPHAIKEIVESTTLPVNVMCMPDLPSFETLTALGVRRISMATWPFKFAYNKLDAAIKEVNLQRSFAPLFESK